MTDFISFSGGTLSIGSMSFTFSLGGLVEVLMFAALFYFLILWFKKTQAWYLLKGLLILAVIYVVSLLLDLTNITFLFEKLFSSILLAAIIIFQPEIRKALEQLGSQKALSGIFGAKEETGVSGMTSETVDDLVHAMTSMSSEKVGALIVLEREVDLTSYAKKGISMDAQVSGALLEQLFVKNTPLHDGALIIRNNRIVAASCVLPLTEQKDLPKDLGTRHRAAIGMSEQSDAIVLVVSEETGDMSIVIGGEIRRHITSEEIRDMLFMKNLTEKEEADKRKKKTKKGRNKVNE